MSGIENQVHQLTVGVFQVHLTDIQESFQVNNGRESLIPVFYPVIRWIHHLLWIAHQEIAFPIIFVKNEFSMKSTE